MAAWVLVGWAHQFRAELVAIAPNRDKASDGSIGDAAHQSSPSGHNPDDTPGSRPERSDADNIPEVRAIDVDTDLRVPGLTAQMIVAYLVGRARAGKEPRLIYVIYNGVIWSASSGWVARRYTGSNPHDKHFHLSGHPDYDNERRPFGLASLNPRMEDDMPLTDADQPVIKAAVHSTQIGRSGVTFGEVMDQMRLLPGQVNAISAFLAAAEAREVARDAAQTTLIQQIAAAAGKTLTPEQVQQVTTAVRDAALQAGQEAAERIAATLREQVADEFADRLAS